MAYALTVSVICQIVVGLGQLFSVGEIMKYAKLFVLILCLVACGILGQKIITLSVENQIRKNDYSEINSIKYGLFSVNQWKQQLSDIINKELADFDPNENREQLKPLIEQQLLKLIDAVDARLREKNQETFKGRMKQAMINTFVDMKDIKSGIPQYADEIFKLIQKPKTKKTLKSMVSEKVDSYFAKTFEKQDLKAIDGILQRLAVTDLQQAKDILDREIAVTQKEIFLWTWILIGLACALFIFAGLAPGAITSAQFIVMVLVLFILLICGVTTPMIDLEAKIAEMSFMLLDHPVRFLNQILYFQTKSVLDVFWLMITDKDLQMKIVGILMVMFSIAFPVTKLLSSVFYYYDHVGLRKNKMIQFFVLKSGKWSMTDVMIIAIFMAYIGFNGVVASQFDKMQTGEEDMVFLTTNGTSLQPGFYLFLAYTMLALFLSGFVTTKIEKEQNR